MGRLQRLGYGALAEVEARALVGSELVNVCFHPRSQLRPDAIGAYFICTSVMHQIEHRTAVRRRVARRPVRRRGHGVIL